MFRLQTGLNSKFAGKLLFQKAYFQVFLLLMCTAFYAPEAIMADGVFFLSGKRLRFFILIIYWKNKVPRAFIIPFFMIYDRLRRMSHARQAFIALCLIHIYISVLLPFIKKESVKYPEKNRKECPGHI